MIPRVDIAPHGVETTTQGTPLLIGVREASGPPNGCKEFRKFITCHQILYSYLFLIIEQLYVTIHQHVATFA